MAYADATGRDACTQATLVGQARVRVRSRARWSARRRRTRRVQRHRVARAAPGRDARALGAVRPGDVTARQAGAGRGRRRRGGRAGPSRAPPPPRPARSSPPSRPSRESRTARSRAAAATGSPAALHALGLLLHDRREPARPGQYAWPRPSQCPVSWLTTIRRYSSRSPGSTASRRATVLVDDDVAPDPAAVRRRADHENPAGGWACDSTTVKSPPRGTSGSGGARPPSPAGRRTSRPRTGTRRGRPRPCRGSSPSSGAAGRRPAAAALPRRRAAGAGRPGPPASASSRPTPGATGKEYEPSAAVRFRPSGRQAPSRCASRRSGEPGAAASAPRTCAGRPTRTASSVRAAVSVARHPVSGDSPTPAGARVAVMAASA